MERERCHKCSHTFPCKKTLAWHTLEEHDNIYLMFCPRQGCRKTFNRFHLLDSHLKQDHLEETNESNNNNNKDNQDIDNDVHTAVVDGDKGKVKNEKKVDAEKQSTKMNLECPKCYVDCMSIREFNRHVSRKHKGSPYDTDLKCAHCDVTFQNVHLLFRHNEGHHLKIRRYGCRVQGCDKMYAVHAYLADHVRLSHNPNRKKNGKGAKTRKRKYI